LARSDSSERRFLPIIFQEALMKLNELSSRSRPQSSHTLTEPEQSVDSKIHRVEALDNVSADRKRSLQEEMAEIEPNAIGAFHGKERILEETKELAAELAGMSSQLSKLVKPCGFHSIDDEA
jgi:hypothetical protein